MVPVTSSVVVQVLVLSSPCELAPPVGEWRTPWSGIRSGMNEIDSAGSLPRPGASSRIEKSTGTVTCTSIVVWALLFLSVVSTAWWPSSRISPRKNGDFEGGTFDGIEVLNASVSCCPFFSIAARALGSFAAAAHCLRRAFSASLGG